MSSLPFESRRREGGTGRADFPLPSSITTLLPFRSLTYRQLKYSAEDYQQAKRVLRRGETAVFRAWVGADEEWERFGGDGREVIKVDSEVDG